MNVAELKKIRNEAWALNQLKAQAHQIFEEIYKVIKAGVASNPALQRYDCKTHGFEKFMNIRDFPLAPLHQMVIENLQKAGFKAVYFSHPASTQDAVKKPAYGYLQITWEYD